MQLAKGAILSGFTALLREAQIDMEDLDKVMIAGQFGAHLPADSLIGTGILPDAVKDKLVYVGNSSKTGAYMALMSKKAKQEMEKLGRRNGIYGTCRNGKLRENLYRQHDISDVLRRMRMEYEELKRLMNEQKVESDGRGNG